MALAPGTRGQELCATTSHSEGKGRGVACTSARVQQAASTQTSNCHTERDVSRDSGAGPPLHSKHRLMLPRQPAVCLKLRGEGCLGGRRSDFTSSTTLCTDILLKPLWFKEHAMMQLQQMLFPLFFPNHNATDEESLRASSSSVSSTAASSLIQMLVSNLRTSEDDRETWSTFLFHVIWDL